MNIKILFLIIYTNDIFQLVHFRNSSNYIITSMKKTPKMSTYLVGWSIHDFNYQQLVNSSKFSLWARKMMTGKGSLALQEGRLIYSALESYFNIENPIKKIDHIAISDFHFSAMENWGMITFRESALLFDKKTTPTDVIHAGLNTMGHEYAHTWFGNLVTPEFWNVVWLKEGFATYFSYVARSIINPDYQMMDLFVIYNLRSALLSDSIAHNRTMNGRGNGEADTIMGYADFNAYQKGIGTNYSCFYPVIYQLNKFNYLNPVDARYQQSRNQQTSPIVLFITTLKFPHSSKRSDFVTTIVISITYFFFKTIFS